MKKKKKKVRRIVKSKKSRLAAARRRKYAKSKRGRFRTLAEAIKAAARGGKYVRAALGLKFKRKKRKGRR